MWQCTHVCFDVEILEVEGVLPDVNAYDRDKREERVLVGCGGDLKTFAGRIETLLKDESV